MVITFFASQAQNFGDGRNVLVTEVPNTVTSDELASDLNSMFTVAFSAHNYLDSTQQYNAETNSDLEWTAYLNTWELGVQKEIIEIGTHKCSREDYGKFYEPLEEQKPLIE